MPTNQTRIHSVAPVFDDLLSNTGIRESARQVRRPRPYPNPHGGNVNSRRKCM
jgi:hypothetical protein